MSTRDLRVRFVGDAGNLKQSFTEVTAGAQQAGAGIRTADASAQSVGTSFTKTGKVFRGVGRAFKSSGADAAAAGTAFASTIPALSGVAGGAGQAVLALDSLSSVAGGAGPAGLAVLGGAAIAAAAAYALLHNDVSAATDAMRAQAKANAEAAASHRAVTDAVYAHKDALAALQGASLSGKDAALSLEQANVAVARALRESGKGSIEYRQALLDQQRVQLSVRAGREDLIRQAEAAIEQTHKTTKSIDDEVRSTREAANAARQRALGLKLGLIAGKDAAGAAKEVRTAIAAEGKAASEAAGKHRDNAQRAREMAAAIGTATPKARALHDRLIELSNTELNSAQWVSAVNSLIAAAGRGIAVLDQLLAAIHRSAAADPTPRGGGGGGGRPSAPGVSGKRAAEVGGKFSNEIMGSGGTPVGTRSGGSASPRTASDASAAFIANRHRDDSLQDKRVRAAAEAGATGITNPDKIAATGDRAVAQARRSEITADAADVKKAIDRVNKAITGKRKTLAAQRAKRRKAPKKAQAAWSEKIRETLAAIRELFDERRALNVEAGELKAEGEEIDYDISGLDAAITSLPNAVPPSPAEPPSTTGTGADAGISADASAQIDQANARAATAQRGAALSDAMSRTLFNSGTIDPGAGFVTVNINTLHPGDPAIQGEVAKWVVGALGGQGSVPTSAFAAGV